MQANGFFEGIGEAIGDAIRIVVEFLLGIFTNFFGALDDANANYQVGVVTTDNGFLATAVSQQQG